MACSAHRARRRWQEGSSTRLLRAKGDASLSSLASRSGSMDLYYSPGACSLGIHVLMEEIGKPYGLKKVSLKDGEQHKPEFQKINPKAKVPTLMRDDGSVLTEFPAHCIVACPDEPGPAP